MEWRFTLNVLPLGGTARLGWQSDDGWRRRGPAFLRDFDCGPAVDAAVWCP